MGGVSNEECRFCRLFPQSSQPLFRIFHFREAEIGGLPEKEELFARRRKPFDLLEPIVDEDELGHGSWFPCLFPHHQERLIVEGYIPGADRYALTQSFCLKK